MFDQNMNMPNFDFDSNVIGNNNIIFENKLTYIYPFTANPFVTKYSDVPKVPSKLNCLF